MATLKDVIDRLKAEGQLVRNTGTNSIKSVKEEVSVISKNIMDQNVVLKDTFDLLKNWYDEEKTRLALGSVSGSPTPPPSPTPTPAPPPPSPTPTPSGFDFSSLLGDLAGLGLVLGPLALGLGTTIGVIQGQLKALQFVFPKTAKAITESVVRFGDFIKDTFTSIRTTISGFATYVKGLFNVGTSSTIGSVFNTLKTAIGYVIAPFTEATKVLNSIFSTGDNIASVFGRIASGISSFAGVVSKIASAVGKVFLPITIVMTAYDTIVAAVEGFQEEGILGGLEGAVTGFFNSLVFAPLDLLKDVVAWVTGKLGFDETSEIISSFSFSDLWKGIVEKIFNGISAAFASIKEVFTFSEEDMTLLGGLGKLTDIVFIPVNSAINFIKGMFGFSEDDASPFKLQDWITDKINEIIKYISDIFSFLPSVEEMKTVLLSYLPEWMQPESIEAQRESIRSQIQEQQAYVSEGDNYNWRGKSREKIIGELQEELAALEGLGEYRSGTKGFENFGTGTPAVLHGSEAVVPRNTVAGAMLANNFGSDWNNTSGRLQAVQAAAMQSAGSPAVVISAPTVAPVTTSVQGGTTNNNMRATVMGDMGSGAGLARFAN